MSELVSILIPAYNAEQWIQATIRSAIAQTWPACEIIVIDDGSRDRTLAAARAFESHSVKVLTQPNIGAAATRNSAFQLAQGSYIQWLDADDLLAPDKIEKQMREAEAARDRSVLLSAPWAHFVYRPTAAKFAPTPLWSNFASIDWMLCKWIHNVHMQTATWLVSRELCEAAGPWNTKLLGDDDGECFARVVLKSREVRFVKDARVFYRIVGINRLSHIGDSGRKLEAQLRSMKLQIEYVRAVEDTPRVHAAIMCYLQAWLPHFYPERPDLVDEIHRLAAAAEGELRPAHIAGKYALIDRCLGREAAKRIQMHCRERRTAVLRSWDRLMLQLGID